VEVSEVAEPAPRTGWHRLRAGLRLALLLTGLGIALAALIGVLALVTAAVLDRALG